MTNYDDLTAKETKILSLMGESHQYRDYFLRRFKKEKWFYILRDNGFFDPKYMPNVEPVTDGGYIIPEWNVLPFLERLSLSSDPKIVTGLIAVIQGVSSYSSENALDNPRTWWYFIKIIVNLPNSSLSIDLINHLRKWLSTDYKFEPLDADIVRRLFPKLLENNVDESIVEKTFEIITGNRESGGRIKPLIQPYWLYDGLIRKELAVEFGKICSIDSIYELSNTIKEIKPRYGYTYSILRPLKDRKKDPHYDYLEVLIIVLIDVILGKYNSSKEDVKEILEKYLSNDFDLPIFKRIALYIIGEKWDSYSDMFWQFLKEENAPIFINRDRQYSAEIYYALQNNVESIESDKKKNKFRVYLEKTIDENVSDGKEEHIIRQYWYSALKEIPWYNKLYKQAQDQTGIIQDVSFNGIKSHLFVPKSPLKEEEINSMSNSELASFIRGYKSENYLEHNENGLAEALQKVAYSNPEKFTTDTDPLVELGYIYVYHIVQGLKKAFNEGKDIIWDSLIKFLIDYILTQDFKEDKLKIENDTWNANKNWVYGCIGELLQDATRDDRNAIPEENMEGAKELLFNVIDDLSQTTEKFNDPISHVLNSTQGKVYTALLFWALRKARLEKMENSGDGVLWQTDVKDKFDQGLEKEILDVIILVGQYQSNFRFLDPRWTAELSDELLSAKYELWNIFMYSFLYGCSMAKRYYPDMKAHYEKAVNEDLKYEEAKELLISQLASGFLNDEEPFKNLFWEFLKDWDKDRTLKTLHYFWQIHDNLPENSKAKFTERILEFWMQLYRDYEKKINDKTLTSDDKSILADTHKLIVYLDDLKDDSDQCRWLLQIAPFINYEHKSSWFVKNLNELKDRASEPESTAKCLGKIFKSIPGDQLPDWVNNEVYSIVKFVYKNGAKEFGDIVCNKFAENGQFFLKDLWEKYNQSTT